MMTIMMLLMTMMMTLLTGWLWWSNLWLPPTFYRPPYKVYLLHCDAAFEQDCPTMILVLHANHCICKRLSRQAGNLDLQIPTKEQSRERLTRKQNRLVNSCWQAEIMSAAQYRMREVLDMQYRMQTEGEQRRTTQPRLTAASRVGHVLHKRRRRYLLGNPTQQSFKMWYRQ